MRPSVGPPALPVATTVNPLPWLAAPDELASWRVIATVLARLQDPAALDPVTALDAFIRQTKFDLSIRQITIEIPEDAHIRPDGNFTIYHRKSAGDPIPYVFEKTTDEKRWIGRAFEPFIADIA